MTTPAADEREKFWHDWFVKHMATADGRAATWLDYSSDETRGRAVQAQTRSLVMEAAGAVANLRCLDAGSGWGQLARCLDVLEAKATALDFVDEMMVAGRKAHPSVRWVTGSFMVTEQMQPLGTFDRVFSIEALQCVGPDAGLRALWKLVAPGGRLIATLPNADNELAQKVAANMPGRYDGMSPSALMSAVSALPGHDFSLVRGMMFAEDQRIAPYVATPWTASPDWALAPNRLIFVAARKA